MDEERAREKKGSPASELKKKKAPSSPKPSIAKLTSISTRRTARMPFKRVRRNCLHCHHFFSFFLLFSSISRNSQPPHQTLQYWAAKRLCVCACVSNTTVFSDIRKKKKVEQKKKSRESQKQKKYVLERVFQALRRCVVCEPCPSRKRSSGLRRDRRTNTGGTRRTLKEKKKRKKEREREE